MPDSQYKITAKWTDAGVVSGMQKIEAQIKRNTAALREQQSIKVGTQQQLASVRNNALRERQDILETARLRRAANKEHLTGMDRTLQTAERYQRFGREMSYVWREQTSWIRDYTDETLKLSAAQQKFKLLNLRPEENERAFTAVRNTVQSLKGLTLTGVTETIGDLHMATGSLDH